MNREEARVRLVCFDLGGVLLRICRSWAEGCAAAGLDERGDVDAVRSRPDGWLDLNAAYQTGRIDVHAFACRFSAMIDGLYGPEEILRVHRAWILGEFEGAAALVDRIHAAGLDTAALSNSCAEHWGTLRRYPAVWSLRRRFGSHEIALRKPDPAAYRVVETRTGHAGRAILFFDDLPENVAAAEALGWQAALIDPTEPTVEQMTVVLRGAGALDGEGQLAEQRER